MADITRARMTAQEFLALPESNQIIELIDGELCVNPPVDKHQEVSGSFYSFLKGIIPGGKIRFAPTGVYFDDANIVEPDVFWVSDDNSRCQLVAGGKYWSGPPDLIVEVFSPSTARKDRTTKLRLYQEYGVREYWMVDPDAEYIEVQRLQDGKFVQIGIFGPGETFVSEVLGNRTIDVTTAFTS